MNISKSLSILLLVLLAGAAVCNAQETGSERKPLSEKNWNSKLRDGDMVFIRSYSDNAKDIAALSGPDALSAASERFTHCGIVFQGTNGWVVYEGRGRKAQDPVTLKTWQIEEASGHPLKPIYVRALADRSLLTKEVLEKMKGRASALHHTRYDSGFMWSTDNFVYCSELIWKSYFTGLNKNVLKAPHPIRDYFVGLSVPTLKEIKRKLNLPKARDCRPEGHKDFSDGEEAIIPEEIYESPGLASVTDESADRL